LVSSGGSALSVAALLAKESAAPNPSLVEEQNNPLSEQLFFPDISLKKYGYLH
jgi:hypothetical protein